MYVFYLFAFRGFENQHFHKMQSSPDIDFDEKPQTVKNAFLPHFDKLC